MIADLRLQNFRSYKDRVFSFNSAVNIIVGPNASGKTNLLEAILVASIGSSYRVKDSELIRHNQSWSRLDCVTFFEQKRTLKIQNTAVINKVFEIDSRTFKRLKLQNKLPLVLFEPNHLQLLTAGPEVRRDFIDNLLDQTVEGYGSILRRYKRTLIQRNRLLKQNAQLNQFFPWNIRLAELGGLIVGYRSRLCQEINASLSYIYRQISSTVRDINIEYGSQWENDRYETQMIKKLECNVAQDTLRGFTSCGPHREDINIYFNHKPVTVIASRGELRTIILSLKLVELRIIESKRNFPPILLLDDVFSELDSSRRQALTEYIEKYQAFITTTDADVTGNYKPQNTQIIRLGL